MRRVEHHGHNFLITHKRAREDDGAHTYMRQVLNVLAGEQSHLDRNGHPGKLALVYLWTWTNFDFMNTISFVLAAGTNLSLASLPDDLPNC